MAVRQPLPSGPLPDARRPGPPPASGEWRRRAGAGWWAATVLAAAIALYGLGYVVVGAPMYPPNLRDSFLARPWGIYPHALFGSLALLTGAAQFHRGLLARSRRAHRVIGTAYVAACAVVGVAGLYMAPYANGGWATRLGFAALAVGLLYTTARAYVTARARRIAEHRRWMLRSYALIFAAVTLRVQLPLLINAFGAFPPAYLTVAWLSWVPNLLWAEWWLRRTRGRALPTG